jgi:hypothetical protein
MMDKLPGGQTFHTLARVSNCPNSNLWGGTQSGHFQSSIPDRTVTALRNALGGTIASTEALLERFCVRAVAVKPSRLY